MLGVARGMEFLRANNVLHGDLKASNVLLSITEAASGDAATGEVEMEVVPKVSDFGLSRIMREGATHHSTHTMGTITHQAPGVCLALSMSE
jgi:serine/threonine protein kinase